jgi:hypothetical protein
MTPPLLLLVLLAGHLSSATKWDGLTPWFSGSCEFAPSALGQNQNFSVLLKFSTVWY